jgi:hypothetical protein
MAVREGNLEAPTRHPIDWKNPEFYDEESASRSWSASSTSATAAAAASACAVVPDPVRPGRRRQTSEVDGVDKQDYWKVVDQCYLCDLCYMTKCPYVPPHQWNVDFPHTMLRAKAIKFSKGGVDAGARLLASTDVHGQFAGIPIVTQVANAVNRPACARGAGEDPARRPPRLAAGAGHARFRSAAPQSPSCRSRTASARPARWRSSPPATSTTTSRASASTC